MVTRKQKMIERKNLSKNVANMKYGGKIYFFKAEEILELLFGAEF